MKIKSPFEGQSDCLIVREIESGEIIDAYSSVYHIDVKRIFNGIEKVYLCQCPNTSLRFFYPYGLDGDSRFYSELSQNDWYYQKERWEHKVAINYVKNGDYLLEIGSGSGAFIKQLIREKEVSYCGLELNHSAIEIAATNGVVLTDQLLTDHVKHNLERYNVVCSFQVFEHVSDIDHLFKDSLKALKSGGLLIVSVPNNDVTFIEKNRSESRFLNLPPHHTNLFNEESLRKIAELYQVKLKVILKEPLDEIHVDVFIYNKMLNFFMGSSFLIRVFWKLKLHIPLRPIVRLLRSVITGHTIMAIYEKK